MKISIEQIAKALRLHGMVLKHSFAQVRYHRISVSAKETEQFPRHFTVMGIKFQLVSVFGEIADYECVFSDDVLQDSVKVSFECTR